MLRIRFHGRGGQGVKTASRIVGTAAFRQGYFAQDSPVYGAERRGAPIVAFTRFDSRPILERGVVLSPDLLVVADESLLADLQVRPLDGVTSRTLFLINSPREQNFTDLALRLTGTTSSLSVALGAAAAKLAGIERKFVDEAIREELESLGFAPSPLETNLKLADASFDLAKACKHHGWSAESKQPAVLVTPAYAGSWLGTASVASSANTPLRKTGDWRVMRPVIDFGRCTHCWICFENCPDGAISLKEHDVPEIDYGVCKGCLICVEECPIHGIEAVRETECRT